MLCLVVLLSAYIVQTRLPALPTLLSTQLRNLLTHLERIVGHSLPVIIVRQNTDGMEIEFANMLVEDSNNDALSYTDCAYYRELSCTGLMLNDRFDDSA